MFRGYFLEMAIMIIEGCKTKEEALKKLKSLTILEETK